MASDRNKIHHWNQHGGKPVLGQLQSSTVNTKENPFFAWVALLCLLFPPGLANDQKILKRCLMAHLKGN